MNWKTFISNWRESVVSVLGFLLVFFLLGLLGSDAVAGSAFWSNLVSTALSLAGGVLRFMIAAAAAWFALAATFPEANRTIVGEGFDEWWRGLTTAEQCRISLVAVAVLFTGASLCMAA